MKLTKPVICSIILLFFTISWPVYTNAQTSINTDSLLLEAHRLAAEKQYAAARDQARQVLRLAPDYKDATLLIGRTFAWEQAYDSARAVLLPLLHSSTTAQSDVLLALSSVELWDSKPYASLQYVEKALLTAPLSSDMALAKAKALRDLQKYKEAESFLKAAIEKVPADAALLELQEQLEDLSRINRISIDYQFTTFDEDIPNWQLGTIQYTRSLAAVTFSGKVNYAQRFGMQALQGELEAWPRINDKTYAYLNFGLSESEIFPDYRAGAELYRSLPYQLEVSLGIRSLLYTHQKVWLYTGHVGKYFQKYWASFRPFLQYQHNNWQATGILQLRRYFRHSDEYIAVSVAKGSTPSEYMALQEINRLDAGRISLEGKFRLGTAFLAGGLLQFEKEEYTPGSSRNRFTSGLSLQYKF